MGCFPLQATSEQRRRSPGCFLHTAPIEKQAKSVAMIQHSMTIVGQIIDYLNPGQTPVIACDQPLYALAKQIQLTWLDRFGKSQYFVMFGVLHIEIAALKTLGGLLENSEWTGAFELANVASSCMLIHSLVFHVGRTFYAHQVTACALHMLMHRAFVAGDRSMEDVITFEVW